MSEKFKPVRGITRLSNENLLSHSTEKLRRGTFLRFTKFLLSKKSLDKRVGEGEEYHVNLLIFFCLTVPKNFVEEPFYSIKVFWERNTLWIGGGE